jgi:probable HAF family extracellular repeat protein
MTRFAITGLLLLGILLGEPKAGLANTVTTLGFVDTGGVFTTFNVPGALATFGVGINDSGQIVGTYISPTTPPGGGELSFVYSAGVFTTLEVPSGFSSVTVNGINDGGQIVGYFYGPNNSYSQGFVDAGGVFTPVNVPGANFTYPLGISNNGQIVGVTFQGDVESAFLYSAGVFSTVNLPGDPVTNFYGINDSGQIVGISASGFEDTGGVVTTVNAPGAARSTPYGINNSGQIVGSFQNQFAEGFGFEDTGGVFTSVNFPGLPALVGFGGYGTFPEGINDNGQIVGVVVIPGVPEPSYLIPLCFGMAALALALRGRAWINVNALIDRQRSRE